MNQVTILRAGWVVPVDRPPIRDGWVALAADRIAAVESGHATIPDDLAGGQAPREVRLPDAALLPPVVNAHTHLELSSLRGRVPPASNLPSWVRCLMRERADGVGLEGCVEAAIDEARRFGTGAVADVSNTLATVQALEDAAMPGVVFHEVLGFDPRVASARAEDARRRVEAVAGASPLAVRVAPHAPYSTSPELIREVTGMAARAAWPPSAVHVAESREEIEFLARGDGPWRALLDDLGVSAPAWRAPAMSPVAYLDALGMWLPGVLAVHGVHLSDGELDLLASRDVTLVTCPRSNEWVGAGAPPVSRFARSGVRVAVGTDSLASAPDLNVFAELQRLHEIAPDVSPRTLLSWATINGAVALGMSDEIGTLVPGRSASLLAVRVGAGCADPELAIVSGVSASDISWIDGGTLAAEAGAAQAFGVT